MIFNSKLIEQSTKSIKEQRAQSMKEKCVRSLLLFSLFTLVVGNNLKAAEEEIQMNCALFDSPEEAEEYRSWLINFMEKKADKRQREIDQAGQQWFSKIKGGFDLSLVHNKRKLYEDLVGLFKEKFNVDDEYFDSFLMTENADNSEEFNEEFAKEGLKEDLLALQNQGLEEEVWSSNQRGVKTKRKFPVRYDSKKKRKKV